MLSPGWDRISPRRTETDFRSGARRLYSSTGSVDNSRLSLSGAGLLVICFLALLFEHLIALACPRLQHFPVSNNYLATFISDHTARSKRVTATRDDGALRP